MRHEVVVLAAEEIQVEGAHRVDERRDDPAEEARVALVEDEQRHAMDDLAGDDAAERRDDHVVARRGLGLHEHLPDRAGNQRKGKGGPEPEAARAGGGERQGAHVRMPQLVGEEVVVVPDPGADGEVVPHRAEADVRVRLARQHVEDPDTEIDRRDLERRHEEVRRTAVLGMPERAPRRIGHGERPPGSRRHVRHRSVRGCPRSRVVRSLGEERRARGECAEQSEDHAEARVRTDAAGPSLAPHRRPWLRRFPVVGRVRDRQPAPTVGIAPAALDGRARDCGAIAVADARGKSFASVKRPRRAGLFANAAPPRVRWGSERPAPPVRRQIS
jgi:hypothetical protein